MGFVMACKLLHSAFQMCVYKPTSDLISVYSWNFMITSVTKACHTVPLQILSRSVLTLGKRISTEPWFGKMLMVGYQRQTRLANVQPCGNVQPVWKCTTVTTLWKCTTVWAGTAGNWATHLKLKSTDDSNCSEQVPAMNRLHISARKSEYFYSMTSWFINIDQSHYEITIFGHWMV
jgi:hypothetical protein